MAKKSTPVVSKEPKLDTEREMLILGHLVKYNLYLLTKSIIFSSLLKQTGDVQKALNATETVIGELDLDTKSKSEKQN